VCGDTLLKKRVVNNLQERLMLICVLDTETTGIDPHKDEVIEVGVALVDTATRSILKVFSSLVLPEELPPNWDKDTSLINPARHINNIDPEALIADPCIQPDLSAFYEIIAESDVIVAHNAAFDRPLVDRMLISKGKKSTSKSWICSNKYLSFPKQAKSRKLIHLAADHNISSLGAHRALADVFILSQLILLTDDIDKQIKSAMLPRFPHIVDKVRSFELKDVAKEMGFRWNGDEKVWSRELTDQEAHDIIVEGRLPISRKSDDQQTQ
jgi:DNA polymerase III subunit epsilon